jgi:4-amino-4-deoxy-L-arabinose transferase-like glycosyltransferase
MLLSKNEKIFFSLTIILLLIAYTFGLSIDVTRDASKYAYISKEIALHGNWLNVMILGEPYYQKPQLLFWLSAISFKIFGISNFTFKLPVFIYSLVGFYAVFRLGKSLFNTKIGILSSLIVMFSVISFLYNMDIHTDIVLMTNVALSLWMLIEYLKQKKLAFLIGSGVALGLSLLTKGPFGVIIPFFAVAGFLFSTKKIESFFNWGWVFILLIAFVIAAPAVIPLCLNQGIKGLKFFLWDNNFRRVIGDYKGSINDPIFYFHNISYLFLPWSIVLFSGIFFQFKKFFKRKNSPSDHFVFWSTWVFFILISISKNKLPNYLLSLVPLLSIITAKGWETIYEEKLPKLILSHKILLYLIWVTIFVLPIFILPGMNLVIWFINGSLFLVAFLFLKSEIPEKKLFLQTLLTATCMSLILNLHIYIKLFNLQGAPVAAKIINVESWKNEKVFFLYPKDIIIREDNISTSQNSEDRFTDILTELHFYRNYEFMFYCNSPVIYVEHIDELPEIINQSCCWIYTDEAGKDEVNKYYSKKTITPIPHFNLKKISLYLNPKTKDSSIERMYLLHLEK